jgi:hypothetical protein
MTRKAAARPLVRVPAKTYAELRRLAGQDDRTMSDVLAEAVERYRRERFLAEAGAEYDAWTPAQKRRYRRELAEWDSALADGLPDEPE